MRVPALAALGGVVLIAAACGMPTDLDLDNIDMNLCPSTVPARGVSMRVADANLRVGFTVQVFAMPVDASGAIELCAPGVQFASSDPGVATVSSTGLVTGASAGTAYIRASSGNAVDSLAIKVSATPLASVVIKFAPPSLLLRQTVKLGLEARDTDGNVATPGIVRWRSEDTTVATITNTGLLVAVGEGTATVTLEAEAVTAVARIAVSDEAPARRFRQIATGEGHTCAIVGGGGVPEGTAYCWGDGALGQLGVGQKGRAAAPIRVSGEHTFTFIAAAGASSCGITTSGETYCWGANGGGQLGDGTRLERTVPVRVPTTHAFRAIAIGAEMACGLTADGSVYCWGRVGNTTAAPPTLVPGGIRFVELTGGGAFVCGRTSAGRAYCWGSTDTWAGAAPTAPGGDLLFSQISASPDHVCGVSLSDGLGYCWGRMLYRPLGTGVSFSTRVTPVAIPGGLRYTSVSAGGSFTCGVTATRSYCLGTTPFSNSERDATPVAIPREPRAGFIAMASARSHSCAIDIRGGGWCWGVNGDGQAGVGELGVSTNEPLQLRIP